MYDSESNLNSHVWGIALCETSGSDPFCRAFLSCSVGSAHGRRLSGWFEIRFPENKRQKKQKNHPRISHQELTPVLLHHSRTGQTTGFVQKSPSAESPQLTPPRRSLIVPVHMCACMIPPWKVTDSALDSRAVADVPIAPLTGRVIADALNGFYLRRAFGLQLAV